MLIQRVDKRFGDHIVYNYANETANFKPMDASPSQANKNDNFQPTGVSPSISNMIPITTP